MRNLSTAAALLAAALLAGCTASHAAPDPKGRATAARSERVPPKPSTFWVWASLRDARAFAALHPRSRLCFYDVPDGVATAGCRSIRVPVDGLANAKELSGPKWLGGAFDCLEYIPRRRVLQSCSTALRIGDVKAAAVRLTR